MAGMLTGGNKDGKYEDFGIDKYGNLLVGGREHEITPIKLFKNGGSEVSVIDGTGNYDSGLHDITKYKSIEVFVRNRVQGGVRASVMAGVGSINRQSMSFFDWNVEEWVASTVSGRIELQRQPSALYVLSSHPNFYWVKNLKAERLQLRFEPINYTESGTVEAWIVGELNG